MGGGFSTDLQGAKCLFFAGYWVRKQQKREKEKQSKTQTQRDNQNKKNTERNTDFFSIMSLI